MLFRSRTVRQRKKTSGSATTSQPPERRRVYVARFQHLHRDLDVDAFPAQKRGLVVAVAGHTRAREDLVAVGAQALGKLIHGALKTLSGWPDYALDTYTSAEGQAKEVHSMVDSKLDYLREFDLDATFHNMAEEPISRLFYTWLRYEAMVFQGTLNPLPRFIANNEIDYNTRIYRIITDRNDLYVSKIAACGASFPVSLPTGEFANYDSTQVLAPKKDITIRFKCNGAMYYDDILKQEFNEVVMTFNADIRTAYRTGNLAKKGSVFRDVSRSGIKDKFRGYVYPFIDLETDRFMWLVNVTDPRVAYIMGLLDYEIGRASCRERV